jgi:hypothetical protein
MTRATKSFTAVACGALVTYGGLFEWFGPLEVSLVVAGVGLLVMLVGAGLLLSTQSGAPSKPPHPAVYPVLALVIAFHIFQNLTMMSAGFAWGFFLWALLPYGLVLVLSCFEGTRLPVVAGAALALAVDVWNYYEVSQSTSSTAVLNFIWAPIWNTIIVVPAATFVAWLLVRQRQPASWDAP